MHKLGQSCKASCRLEIILSSCEKFSNRLLTNRIHSLDSAGTNLLAINDSSSHMQSNSIRLCSCIGSRLSVQSAEPMGSCTVQMLGVQARRAKRRAAHHRHVVHGAHDGGREPEQRQRAGAVDHHRGLVLHVVPLHDQCEPMSN